MSKDQSEVLVYFARTYFKALQPINSLVKSPPNCHPERHLVILSGAQAKRRIPAFKNQTNTGILPSFHSEPVLSKAKESPSAPQDDSLRVF